MPRLPAALSLFLHPSFRQTPSSRSPPPSAFPGRPTCIICLADRSRLVTRLFLMGRFLPPNQLRFHFLSGLPSPTPCPGPCHLWALAAWVAQEFPSICPLCLLLSLPIVVITESPGTLTSTGPEPLHREGLCGPNQAAPGPRKKPSFPQGLTCSELPGPFPCYPSAE